MAIGLEGIAFDIPEYFLDMKELAQARGVEPTKYTIGLGQQEMSVATPCEDSVTLAVGAGRRLLKNFDIDPFSISHVIVGTETGIDQSTSISSYVHAMLGLSTSCRLFEVKQACYGAMAALSMGINYFLSGKAKGTKILIIATDIARYGKGSVGEPTQGAGAVAMLLSDRPNLIEFDTQHDGYFGQHVMDFWRPSYSKEAFVDGHYSIQCYLEALNGAYQLYKKNIKESGFKGDLNLFNQQFVACLYHVPYVKMAQKAHLKLLEIDSEIVFEKDTPEWLKAIEDFNQRTKPFLQLNAQIGNVYTASLFISLFNFLENDSQRTIGQPISLFSYGSGCSAEFITAKVLENAHSLMKDQSSKNILACRKRIDIDLYEDILEACTKMDSNNETICQPEQWGLQREEVFLGVKDHKRIYSVEGKIIQ